MQRPIRQTKPLDRLEPIPQFRLRGTEAEQMRREVARHRRALLRRLGRDVGPRVALLDYLVNVHPEHVDATVIPTDALEAIRNRAITDALTGLYDRGHFERALQRELERCRRHGTTSSLLLLDLDEFKEINDEYGHRVGDKVLQALTALMRRHVRSGDVPCRLGGDEFCIVLPDTPQVEAMATAERFRADVETWFESHAVCGQFLEVSVSGGIATAPTDALGREELFVAADRALYDAKRRGGNCIVTS
jgi:diguanylate cyclase (GGDEF)-like protein